MDFQHLDRQLKGARRRGVVLFVLCIVQVATIAFLALNILRETNQVVCLTSAPMGQFRVI